MSCPTCGSTAPHMHPAIQHEGEVELCADAFHLTPTRQNRPEYIAAVQAMTSPSTDALVESMRSLADCDARAGEPLGKALRHWADFVEAVLERSPNGEPVEVAIHPNGDWSVYNRASPLPQQGQARELRAWDDEAALRRSIADVTGCQVGSERMDRFVCWFREQQATPNLGETDEVPGGWGHTNRTERYRDWHRVWADYYFERGEHLRALGEDHG